MNRVKKLPARKKTALRRGAICLLLAAACVGMGGYGLLPRRGIYYSEENVNMGRTSVIRSLGSIPMKKTGLNRLYLCANDNGMLMALTRFYFLYGWLDYGFHALDCSHSAPVHIGAYSISRTYGEEEYERIWYLYGRVDEPDAASLQISIGYHDEKDAWVSIEKLELPEVEWLEAEGRTYFVRELPEMDIWNYDYPIEVMAELTDTQGNLLHQQEVTQSGGTSLG